MFVWDLGFQGMPAKYQLFEPLTAEESSALEKDCLERGIQIPVEVDEKGTVLDGHNRVAIAKKHGLKYETVVREFLTEEEKKVHVLMLNMARRHLKSHQWGLAFKRLLDLRGVKTSRGPKGRNDNSATVAEIAGGLGVPTRTAERRLEQADVYESLPPEEQSAVDAGEKSISSATRKQKQSVKRKEAGKTAKLSGKFSVVYSDPPWKFGATTVTGGADQHYAAMATKEIEAIPVKDHATRDAVLFLWTTNAHLPDALAVVSAWGFSYKTNLVWVKDKATSGLGEYVKGKHEILLIATRGSMLPEFLPQSVFQHVRLKHSEKPDAFAKLIERMYPDQVYLELFARKKRNGWSRWGAES